MMHLHRHVPFWVIVCGHVVGVSEGKENAHLCTVWYDSPSGCMRLCRGGKVCMFMKMVSPLVSHQDGAGGLP